MWSWWSGHHSEETKAADPAADTVSTTASEGYKCEGENEWAHEEDPIDDEPADEEEGKLLSAAKAGDVGEVSELLQQGACVDSRDKVERTALHWASAFGHRAVVARLLESDANLEARDKKGSTALHLASSFGHVDIVNILLRRNAVVDAVDRKHQTPLHLAIGGGHQPTIHRLLEANASLKAIDDDGFTVLHWASYFGHTDIVEFLLQQNVNVDALNKIHSTPLRVAFRRKHTEVVKRLIQAGATINDGDGGNGLLRACSRGDEETVQLLLTHPFANISVDVKDKDNVTPLHRAACYGHVEVVKLLLQAKAYVDARAADACTPLHRAAENGREEVVELLLNAHASVDAVTKSEETPLHRACEKGRLKVVELLFRANANVEATDMGGETPLFKASYFQRFDILRFLLSSNAKLHARDNEGREVLHRLLEFRDFGEFNSQTLHTIQVLVEFGAKWDEKCDEMVAQVKAWDEAPAVALCMQLWNEELVDGIELTSIPIEVIKRGKESTQTFVDSIKTSQEIVFRRKICLVGQSCAGKTSFIKSIKNEAPQLEPLAKRTIGIEHFRLRFKQSIVSRSSKIHEVTFWDFAGQDAYQVAHSLFFSPRTLFLVFVDLQGFSVAYKQAKIFGQREEDEAKLLNEYFERAVLHWVHLIIARQQEAEFVFLATKEDLVEENNFMKSELKKELEKRLRDVVAVVTDMKAAAKQHNGPSHRCVGVHGLLSKGQLSRNASMRGICLCERWQGRGANRTGRGYDPTVLYVSCLSRESVASAKAKVEDIIVKSDLSVPMPDIYSDLLNTVVQIRKEAKQTGVAARVARVFASKDKLLEELPFDETQSLQILQTLNDLGDVLWYENLDVPLFRQVIILDPLLLIDFIRQVIDHNRKDVMMTHDDLMARPFWENLNDPSSRELLLSMKMLMQIFHLVYSEAEDRQMKWDSDLIVPAAWKTNVPVAQRFLAGKLGLEGTEDEAPPERTRVRWEYDFAFGLSPNLFDHVVVASVSPWLKFDAGPDWLWYRGEHGRTACRVMIDRDRHSLHRKIHVEAVIAEKATPHEESKLWEVFKGFVCALVTVISNNRGLAVACQALDDGNSKKNLKNLLSRTDRSESLSWMPPPVMWKDLRLLDSA